MVSGHASKKDLHNLGALRSHLLTFSPNMGLTNLLKVRTFFFYRLPRLTAKSTKKKQHLMIFMRALLTTIISQCRLKALNTELAVACLYKAVMRFMTS